MKDGCLPSCLDFWEKDFNSSYNLDGATLQGVVLNEQTTVFWLYYIPVRMGSKQRFCGHYHATTHERGGWWLNSTRLHIYIMLIAKFGANDSVPLPRRTASGVNVPGPFFQTNKPGGALSVLAVNVERPSDRRRRGVHGSLLVAQQSMTVDECCPA